MSNHLIKIHNAKIITPYRVINTGSILIRDGIIAAVSEGNIEISGAQEIDAGGNYVAPGFIDLHVHGVHRNHLAHREQEAGLRANLSL